jgi:hypothetical protein
MTSVTDRFEPALEQILAFCAQDPVERVFLEDVARRRLGRFTAFGDNGSLTALCHVARTSCLPARIAAASRTSQPGGARG